MSAAAMAAAVQLFEMTVPDFLSSVLAAVEDVPEAWDTLALVQESRELTRLREELGGVAPTMQGYVRALRANRECATRIAGHMYGMLGILCVHGEILSPAALATSCTFPTGCILVDTGGQEIAKVLFADGLLPRPEDCFTCPHDHYKEMNRDAPDTRAWGNSSTFNALLSRERASLVRRAMDGGADKLLLELLLWLASCMMCYTGEAVWERVWGTKRFLGGCHARVWLHRTLGRFGIHDLQKEDVMYGDCPSLSVDAPELTTGKRTNAGELNGWLVQTVVDTLVSMGAITRRYTGGRSVVLTQGDSEVKWALTAKDASPILTRFLERAMASIRVRYAVFLAVLLPPHATSRHTSPRAPGGYYGDGSCEHAVHRTGWSSLAMSLPLS